MSHVQPLLVHGEWVEDTGATLVPVNPATGAQNPPIAAATAEVVAQAVRSAVQAASDPAWRRMFPHQRGRLLAKLADVAIALKDSV